MFEEIVYAIGTTVILAGCALRASVATAAAVRTFLTRESFLRLEFGAVEAAVVPEPILLAAATGLMGVFALDWGDASWTEAGAAAIGAAFVAAGWNLTLWSWVSWRNIFFGHAISPGQRLVTSGAYGFVRHPVYLGVVLMWFGLAAAFHSPPVLAAAVVYVTPAYVLYARSEERMMQEEFGNEYRAYQRSVPMLVPWLGRPSRSDLGA